MTASDRRILQEDKPIRDAIATFGVNMTKFAIGHCYKANNAQEVIGAEVVSIGGKPVLFVTLRFRQGGFSFGGGGVRNTMGASQVGVWVTEPKGWVRAKPGKWSPTVSQGVKGWHRSYSPCRRTFKTHEEAIAAMTEEGTRWVAGPKGDKDRRAYNERMTERRTRKPAGLK